MNVLVIYFSQSGGTKKIARAIHAGLRPLVDRCTLKSLPQVQPRELLEYDVIALGSAVWGGVPLHVKRFVQAWPPLRGRHAFTFSTHGAKPERFFPTMIRLLNRKGLTVLGARDWYGSVHHPLLPKPYLTDGHPDEIDLREAADFGREMAGVSGRVAAGEKGLIPAIPPMPPPRTLKRPMTRKKLDPSKCRYPECTLCVDHCRLQVIDLSTSPPSFPEKCPPCYFCELICPTGAIEADYQGDAKLETGRARAMFIEALDRAEAEGRFRRHVPLEEVGWETPYYLVNRARPRCVVAEAEDEETDGGETSLS
ncbi:MAG: hypothetical protein HY900_17060 [Deltaproteobacteria bacterium]|nr:hypothetical protein [Deltaproteobacteria bacterium]